MAVQESAKDFSFELPGQDDLNGTFSNLNLVTAAGPHIPVQPVIINHTESLEGNDYSINYSNQNNSHFISLPSSSSNAVVDLHITNDDTKKSEKKKNSFRGAKQQCTLKLHIRAYEASYGGISKGCVDIENRELERKTPKVRKQRIRQFRELFFPTPADTKWAFEFPRMLPTEKDQRGQEPEVAQFKASQKLFNPGEDVPVRQTPVLHSRDLLQIEAAGRRRLQADLMDLQAAAAAGVEDEPMEEDDRDPVLAAQEDLAELQESQTPKKKRKTKKSQSTKAREKSVKEKNRRAEMNLQDGSTQSTPTGRSHRSEQLTPYPVRPAIRPVPSPAQSSHPLLVKQKPPPLQIVSDVVQPRDVANGSTQSAAIPMEGDKQEEGTKEKNGIRVDENGVICIEDEEVKREREPAILIDEPRDPRPIVRIPGVITINDVDNTEGRRAADRRPYRSDEANLSDVVFTSDDCVNAVRRFPPGAWLSGEVLTAFHCGYIPHHTFGIWNQIAFLDPAWQAWPNRPITDFLRVHSDMPELIICHLNIHGNHWVVLAINVEQGEAKYYDPLMTSSHPAEFSQTEAVEKDLCETLLDRLLAAEVIQETRLIKAAWTEFNQQSNTYSCGDAGIILAEDLCEYGFTRKWPVIHWGLERQRIANTLHRLACLNQNPPDNPRHRWKRTLPVWPERPCREDLLARAYQIRLQTQKLAEDNSLIQMVEAKQDVKVIIRPDLRKSQRVIAQYKHKPRRPDLVEKDIRSCRATGKLLGRDDSNIFPDEHYLGPMDKRCKYCKAFLFRDEDCNKCCANGDVPPPEIKDIPKQLEFLRLEDDFWKKIRLYNTLFSMVSITANVKMTDGIFKIQGEPRYNVGDLVPQPDQAEHFAQIYTVLGDDVVERRRIDDLRNMGYNGKEAVCQRVIKLIEDMLKENHPLVNELKSMRQKLAEYEAECAAKGETMKRIYIIWKDPYQKDHGGVEKGRLNLPTMPNQVFAFYKSENNEPPRMNGIYFGIEKDGHNNIREVPFHSGLLDPTTFPLIFHYGQEGWHPEIPKLDPEGKRQNKQRRRVPKPGIAQEQANVGPHADELDAEQAETIQVTQLLGTQHRSAAVQQPEAEVDFMGASSDEDNEERDEGNLYVSLNQHVRKHIYDRSDRQKNDFNPVNGMRQLFQQWLIHKWLNIQQQRLQFQEDIADANTERFDQCHTLRAAIQRLIDKIPELTGRRLGKMKLLPKNYRGGKPYMQKKFRDAIAISTRFGQDDLFVTFTGNPTWREITENLRQGETWIDRPDLVCRVFNLKAAAFLKELLEVGVLGKTCSYKVVLEHQKRGMPHLHILLCLDKEHKLDTIDKIDNIIRCQLAPEPEDDDEHYLAKSRYYEYLLKMMIHDPSRCAVACGKGRRNGKCSKDYPKDYCSCTFIKPDGYAKIERPEDRRIITIKRNRRAPVELTNQWVVPHNRYLLLKYNCHINIEHCGGSRAIKYAHKYVHKGKDSALIAVVEDLDEGDDNGEVDADGNPVKYMDYNEFRRERVLNCVGAAESMERILSMFICKQSHTVNELPVHLPGEHTVVFNQCDEAAKIERLTRNTGLGDTSKAVSPLVGMLKLVREEAADPNIDQTDPARARNLYYHQIPEYYKWLEGKWVRRVRVIKIIGRLQTVYPTNVERYCLRELLKTVRGPSSFEDLKKLTKNNITTTYATFREAAVAYGLFVDDGSSRQLLEEICSYSFPNQCRRIFALILIHHRPENPKKLWVDFRKHFWSLKPYKLTNAQRDRRALAHVASILYHHNLSMTDVNMFHVSDKELENAINDTFTKIPTDGNERYAQLNKLQKEFADAVFHSFDDPTDIKRKRLFFLQAGGGCGKTFVFNTIIRTLILSGYKVISVASTGIAAVLLDNGQTAHSAFRIPLDLTKQISLSATNRRAELIREADVIIWDEAPMQNSAVLEKAAEIIKDLAPTIDDGCLKFANKTMILGGDFKQLLPVIKHALPLASFEASLLCNQKFLDNFNVYTLEDNVRAKEDPEYSEWCNLMGNGQGGSSFAPNAVQLPPDIATDKEKDVRNFVYPIEIFKYVLPGRETEQMPRWKDYVEAVKDSALLSPLNEKVNQLNSDLTSKLKGDSKIYIACNTLTKLIHPGDEFLREQYSSDILNAFEDPGIPPHLLKLKVGSVVMLSRNLDTNFGLCNGTRMIVKKMFEKHILCEVITGKLAGETIPVFAIDNTYEDPDNEWPPFVRRQLPIRPAFAITINKSQGQTLAKVGLVLDAQCFSHGQFYVAITRVRKRSDIKIYVPPNMWGTAVDGSARIPHAINIVLPGVISKLQYLISKTLSKSATVIAPVSPPETASQRMDREIAELPQMTNEDIEQELQSLKQKMAEPGVSRTDIFAQHILMAEVYRRTPSAWRGPPRVSQHTQQPEQPPAPSQPQQQLQQQMPSLQQQPTPPKLTTQPEIFEAIDQLLDQDSPDEQQILHLLRLFASAPAQLHSSQPLPVAQQSQPQQPPQQNNTPVLDYNEIKRQFYSQPVGSRDPVLLDQLTQAIIQLTAPGQLPSTQPQQDLRHTQQPQQPPAPSPPQQQMSSQQQHQPVSPKLPTKDEIFDAIMKELSQDSTDHEKILHLLSLPASAPAKLCPTQPQQITQQLQPQQPPIPPPIPYLRPKEQDVQDFLLNGPSQPPEKEDDEDEQSTEPSSRPLSPLLSQWDD